MKNFISSIFVMVMYVLVSFNFCNAYDFGRQITVYDGRSSVGSSWYGKHEDEEVEPGNDVGQKWDLEAFSINKDNKLNVIGGYDFKNGYKKTQIGDIFIDIDGKYDSQAVNQTERGIQEVKSNFGYEFVIDIDVEGEKYIVYDISNGEVITSTVYYEGNSASNPYTYIEGGIIVAEGEFEIEEGLPDSDVFDLKGEIHNAMIGFDMGFLEGKDFTAHITMSCGNDNLMGSTVKSSVPEPMTMILFGCGLLFIGLISKLKLIKT